MSIAYISPLFDKHK